MKETLETNNTQPGLYSVLAIQDLRRRILAARSQQNSPAQDLQQLLALDPLSVIRLLRMVHAPVSAVGQKTLSLPLLMKVAGRTVVQRALDVTTVASQDTGPIRELWLHAVATALSARSLAETSECMDPDQAYFIGLLHDLPQWLPYMIPGRNEPLSRQETTRIIREWNLPTALLQVVNCNSTQRKAASSAELDSPEALIGAAELLAELADYWHPGEGEAKNKEFLLTLVSREELVAAQNLRMQLSATLNPFMLEASSLVPGNTGIDEHEQLALFPVKSHGSLAEVVTSLLSCNASANYRGIITATTAAALRFLNFERAFMVQWSTVTGRCWIRAKSDLSPRRLEPMMVEPTKAEAAVLRLAHDSEHAQRLPRPITEGHGLLTTLGVDEVLVAPLNTGLQTCSFLVLDRTLSGRPVRPEVDRAAAEALAGTASILNENLLLRKLRRRADQFALTDPLTRLFNRGWGISTLEREMANARRSPRPLTVLMLDLDDFKHLNDEYGHLVGDSALGLTAEVLRKTLRKTDIICRYGGEEFMVVLPETNLEQASILAARVFTSLESRGKEAGLPLTASIGLTVVNPETDTVESTLNRADQALYASKDRGRNRFSVDSPV